MDRARPMRAVEGSLGHSLRDRSKNQKALAWDNGTSRRAIGWAGEKAARSVGQSGHPAGDGIEGTFDQNVLVRRPHLGLATPPVMRERQLRMSDGAAA